MTIGEKIQFYRQARGLTQSQLASSASISLSVVKKYETNARSPKPEYLIKIANVLNISPNALSDVSIDTIGDIAPYLLALSKKCGIHFDTQKDANGNEIADGIKISFDSPSLNVFLKQWADYQKKVDGLRDTVTAIPDEMSQAELLQAINSLEIKLETTLLDSQILLEQKK